MLVNDDFTRHAWVYFLKHKPDEADAFRKFLAHVRAEGTASQFEIVRSDNGGVFFGGESREVCKQFGSRQEFTNADSPKQNGIVERALGIIQNAGLTACIQAPIIFPLVQLPPTQPLWAKVGHWACGALTRTATTANPGIKSLHDMWHGAAAPSSPHPFLRPAYSRWIHPSTSFLRAESWFYLGPGIDDPSDCLRVLTRANKVVKARDVTWEATLDVPASPSRLPELPEKGGAAGLQDAPEPGGMYYFDSAPTTRLPVLGRGIGRQLCAVSPMTQVDDDFHDGDANSKSPRQLSFQYSNTSIINISSREPT